MGARRCIDGSAQEGRRKTMSDKCPTCRSRLLGEYPGLWCPYCETKRLDEENNRLLEERDRLREAIERTLNWLDLRGRERRTRLDVDGAIAELESALKGE
jgi:DNA-directed RNA polymerase subunit RPC12/RpoP